MILIQETKLREKAENARYSMNTPVCVKIGNMFVKIMIGKVEEY